MLLKAEDARGPSPTARPRITVEEPQRAVRTVVQTPDAQPASVVIAPAVPVVPSTSASQPLRAEAAAPTRVDFATLVDTIARAREQAAPQSPTVPVAVSLAHADFGPVALRFRHDGDALAVTMSSADPGFVPAVAAASVADAGARSGQQQQQPADAQPRQHYGSQQPSPGQSGSYGQSFAQAGQGQTGQNQPDPRQQNQARPGAPAPAPRSGAGTADHSAPEPDIFA